MAKCTFCGKNIPRGTGLIFVHITGKISNFCSKKCEKHSLVLNRKPQNMKWITSKNK